LSAAVAYTPAGPEPITSDAQNPTRSSFPPSPAVISSTVAGRGDVSAVLVARPAGRSAAHQVEQTVLPIAGTTRSSPTFSPALHDSSARARWSGPGLGWVEVSAAPASAVTSTRHPVLVQPQREAAPGRAVPIAFVGHSLTSSSAVLVELLSSSQRFLCNASWPGAKLAPSVPSGKRHLRPFPSVSPVVRRPSQVRLQRLARTPPVPAFCTRRALPGGPSGRAISLDLEGRPRGRSRRPPWRTRSISSHASSSSTARGCPRGLVVLTSARQTGPLRADDHEVSALPEPPNQARAWPTTARAGREIALETPLTRPSGPRSSCPRSIAPPSRPGSRRHPVQVAAVSIRPCSGVERMRRLRGRRALSRVFLLDPPNVEQSSTRAVWLISGVPGGAMIVRRPPGPLRVYEISRVSALPALPAGQRAHRPSSSGVSGLTRWE